MRCWACSQTIKLSDLVTELPIVGAIVHIRCYERETGQRAPWSSTVTQALVRLYRRTGPPRRTSA